MRFESNGNLGIFVKDLKKAKEFYGGVLGFKLIDEREGKLTYNTGTCVLYINQEGDYIRCPFVPALEVDNYEEAKRHLTDNGCEVVREWPEYKALFFRDPLGNVIDIIETNKG